MKLEISLLNFEILILKLQLDEFALLSATIEGWRRKNNIKDIDIKYLRRNSKIAP